MTARQRDQDAGSEMKDMQKDPYDTKDFTEKEWKKAKRALEKYLVAQGNSSDFLTVNDGCIAFVAQAIWEACQEPRAERATRPVPSKSFEEWISNDFKEGRKKDAYYATTPRSAYEAGVEAERARIIAVLPSEVKMLKQYSSIASDIRNQRLGIMIMKEFRNWLRDRIGVGAGEGT